MTTTTKPYRYERSPQVHWVVLDRENNACAKYAYEEQAMGACHALNAAHADALRPFIAAGLATPDGEPRKVLGMNLNYYIWNTFDQNIEECGILSITDPDDRHHEEYEEGKRYRVSIVTESGATFDCWDGALHFTREATLAALQTPPAAPSGEVEG